MVLELCLCSFLIMNESRFRTIPRCIDSVNSDSTTEYGSCLGF